MTRVVMRRFLDPDWKRLSRWCLLGTVVMLVWLLVPVARCGFATFRDTPLSEYDPTKPEEADRHRVESGEGFFHDVVAGTRWCYGRTSLTNQEPWKTQLLVGFASATLIAWLVGRITRRSART